VEQNIRDLLAELEAWGKTNDAKQQDRARKMLNLEPDTAHLISMLVRSGQRRRLLEIGTSNGYSTIWLAWAARETGGHVISIDRSDEKRAMAQANLLRAGLLDRVTLVVGDATEIISTQPGPFDFVFFDADRHSAPQQLKLLMHKLVPGALVLADNVHSHPDEIAAYLEAVSAETSFDHMIVPVGKGLSVALKQQGEQ
jgi:predicted O-methyltransferase YrrM